MSFDVGACSAEGLLARSVGHFVTENAPIFAIGNEWRASESLYLPGLTGLARWETGSLARVLQFCNATFDFVDRYRIRMAWEISGYANRGADFVTVGLTK
ncbi:MAG: hypothetical protein AAGD11_20000 [Planctomycetota bacterium]